MYTLGRSIRKTYNAFLGDIYTPDILTAWASSIERCHTSLQLVLAALFPPKGVLIWEKGFNWQPISYNSLPKNLDDVRFEAINSGNFILKKYLYLDVFWDFI